MSENVDRAHEDLIEFDNEDAAKGQLAKPTAQQSLGKAIIFKEWLNKKERDDDETLQ